MQFATLVKGTPTQVFSCEFCEVFKNTFFIELLRWLLLLLKQIKWSTNQNINGFMLIILLTFYVRNFGNIFFTWIKINIFLRHFWKVCFIHDYTIFWIACFNDFSQYACRLVKVIDWKDTHQHIWRYSKVAIHWKHVMEHFAKLTGK